MGFGILALGTGIALLPETAFAFALARVPANAATTALLLLALLLWAAPARAQVEGGETVSVTERSELRRQLESEIMCTCGCNSPMGSCPMRPNCGHYDTQEASLVAYLAEGMDHDAVLAAFVESFGSQAILAAPVDRGFNRLAWLLPYLAAGAALIGIVATTRRWSRQVAPVPAGDATLDPALSARLDDELRNLD